MIRVLFVILFLMLLPGFCLFAQAKIDFFPKPMQGDLQQVSGRQVELKEMKLSGDPEKEAAPGKYFIASAGTAPDVVKYVYVGRVKTCRAGVCMASKDNSDDRESEYFDYYIFFDSRFTVQFVRIFNYQASHGHEVTARGWLKQFRGYNGEKTLVVNKNVDAISGATISVHAITYDISQKTQLIREIVSSGTSLGQVN